MFIYIYILSLSVQLLSL